MLEIWIENAQTYPEDFFAWIIIVFPSSFLKFDQVVEFLVYIIDLLIKSPSSSH